MISHTTIVFSRFIVLSWQNRCHTDERTLGGMFYELCDEVDERDWAGALVDLFEIFDDVLQQTNKKINKLIKSQLAQWIAGLPNYIKDYLPKLGCESWVVIEDLQDNQLEIIYDDPDHKCPLEYVVWSFRWNTEISLQSKQVINSHNHWSKCQHFYKVEHSSYIHEIDKNWAVNSTLFPDVEHHVYMNGDEIFEVISNYEPRFVAKRK